MMIRSAALAMAFACSALLHGQAVNILVHSPVNAGKPVLLYRYDDLFTLRSTRIATALLNDAGDATLEAEVSGTMKLRIRIGEAFGDLYARPGASYTVEFTKPDPRTARSVNGTTRVDLLFTDLDPMDVNALTTDLNDRVDGFINEDLATDQVAGMQILEIQRRDSAQATDSLPRPATLFVTPMLSKVRVDSFEMKIRRFYGEVKDPWFEHYLTYSIAGMRHGPRVDEEELFVRYLKGKPVLYDDPEYVRFIRTFYADQLHLANQWSDTALQRAYAQGSADSLKALLAKNEFLKDNDRLCELVMIDLLYQQYNTKLVQREGAVRVLEKIASASAHPEHRPIARNMLWDLTAMRVGSRMPPMLLEELNGREAILDSLLQGPVCIVLTASWCSYCDLEMQGFEQLQAEYKDVVPIIAIGLDDDLEDLRKYVKSRPGANFHWLHAVAEQQLRDDLRIRSLPAIYLLNDGVLARSPAPLPSKGLGALFHQAREEAIKGSRMKVWDD
jgi:thiol-disulfide isomerase/thioredoxin